MGRHTGTQGYDVAKRAFDATAAAVLLFVLSPVLLIVGVAVRVLLGAPVLFSQQRPGRGGVLFRMHKFRSMRSLAPGEVEDAASDRARLTRFGRFLRSTSLDEFPALVNVLRGEMSLVGPRPLLPEYLPLYDATQSRRHEVLPGITGWAQVNGRNALDWPARLALDVWYVEHRSFLLDLRILALTVVRVLRRDGIAQAGTDTMHRFTGSR